MTNTDHTRRTVLKAAGVSATVALAAGCLGGDDGDDGGNGDGNGGNGDGIDIEPGTQIMFNGQTAGWEGLEPSAIEGETNPTLVLQEGEDYEIGWSEGDGSNHNIQIRDGSDEVVDDLTTEQVSEPDDDQILEFTASSEMDIYRCEPHASMQGDLQIE